MNGISWSNGKLKNYDNEKTTNLYFTCYFLFQWM
jgi:hypothetical protein